MNIIDILEAFWNTVDVHMVLIFIRDHMYHVYVYARTVKLTKKKKLVLNIKENEVP